MRDAIVHRPGREPGMPAARGPAQQGTVLIVVLWVCLGLVSLTLLFGHSMMMAFQGADDLVAGRQADAAIEGAVQYAMYLLANPTVPGQMPLDEDYQREAVAVGEARFWFLGRPSTLAGASEPVFRLVDEASKLNLNTATQEMLEGLPGMTSELAAAIIDWRDEDDEVVSGGAETETYQLRNPSYTCKNARFETVEELALVNGASWDILFGEDANRNGALDPNENDGLRTLPADDADGRLDPGILEYVTVHSREPNVREDGTTRLNVSQASTELRTFLEEQLGETRAAEIQQRTAGQGQIRSVLEYFVRGGVTADEADLLGDALTVSEEPMLEGLVNVNTASEAVLACVPGIDEQQAAQLVATRALQVTPRTSVGWVAEVLGEENAVQAGPYLTAQSWVVGADVAAVGRHGRGYRRRYLVIDATADAPRIVGQRNLGGLGWAMGTGAVEELRAQRGRR